MPLLVQNRRAKFDYELISKYEAGLVLRGYEVKALRDKEASLKGAYLSFRSNQQGKAELYLINCRISLYKHAGRLLDYNPLRERKLLLNKSEIDYLIGRIHTEGLTLIPLQIYTKHSFLKLEFALAKGKKKYDKREIIKSREEQRRLRSLTKRQLRG